MPHQQHPNSLTEISEHFKMRNVLVGVKYNGAAQLLWVLLLLGTGLATAAASGHTPITMSIQATTKAPCTGPPSNPVNSGFTSALHPKQPATGRYSLSDSRDRVCLRADMGAQYLLTRNKKMSFFNIDPTTTKATGLCGRSTSYLSLNFTKGHLQLTFHKEGEAWYVTTIRTSLDAFLICKNCKRELFTGVISNKTLFETAAGLCYKCNTQMTLRLGENLSIKIINVKIQAFEMNDGHFGKEEECWPDYCRRVIPLALGAVAVGGCLIAILVFLTLRDNHPQGYQRI
ncbi:hypothetical protein AGOR_G00144770 [Albula goreensis]|uniref:Lysosome-associated membrane glycoprotein 2-like luminal domain-containing protein n=1 Tax=Albula goreensis TaxID=1534307 RepID=A0A8T3D6B4_9TELE|nr:hypothetical protein AGOR_G00144770 [Albula goreensis]